MIYLLFSILGLFIRVAFSTTAAQLCRGTAERADDGNWYCSEVTAITYKNISQPGEYNRTTRVDPNTGLCDHEPIAYSGVGPTTPLIGELSMHLRGPMNVTQIAVYKLPDMSISKREASRRRNRRTNSRRKMRKPRDEHGTIRSIWHSFWHHTQDDPNTEGQYTTEGADGTTTASAAFTTKSTSVKTTIQAPGPSTNQPIASTTVQTVFSTIKETIATTIVQTIIPTNGQLGNPGMSQLATHGPGFVCTVTPTVTTTIFTQGSTCPNLVPAFTQTQILPPPPYVPIPVPVPVPVPAPALPVPAPPALAPPALAPPVPAIPVQPPPAPASLPALPALSVLLAALSLHVSTTTATTTATTTLEVTDSKNLRRSSSPISQPPASPPGIDETECPCEESSTLQHTQISPTPQLPLPPAAIPPPPPPATLPLPLPPPPPALPALPTSPPSSIPSASSLPCPDSTVDTSVTKAFPPVKRDEERPAVTGVPTLAGPRSGSLLQENDVKRDAASTWSRVAYYTSAAPAAASGFAFLANLGDPQKSGTFDYAFGNSLGYVIGDGSKVAADNTPFDGTLETSEREIAVFTDKVCDDNCEYARPDATAHYGWDGPSKAFFIEFQMDHYDNYGSDQGMLSDAPAWWFLNAAIPRILQYGNDRKNVPCSCWSTGCGEFDAFEILGRGEMRAKSTIHRQGNLEGGDSNYFLRPVGRTIKFAVVFHNWNITARVLDDGFDFGAELTQAQVDDILAYDANDNSHSLYAIGD